MHFSINSFSLLLNDLLDPISALLNGRSLRLAGDFGVRGMGRFTQRTNVEHSNVVLAFRNGVGFRARLFSTISQGGPVVAALLVGIITIRRARPKLTDIRGGRTLKVKLR
jgi:hypothetical protein